MNLSKEKNEDNNIAVYIITHGPECYHVSDSCLPLEVGAALRNNFHHGIRLTAGVIRACGKGAINEP